MKKFLPSFLILSLAGIGAAQAVPVTGELGDTNLFFNSVLYTDQNDCSGTFGQGFDNCTVGGSPIIAKFGDEEIEINDLYPTVTGDEWDFEGGDKSGTWNYTPGTGDPLIKFWTVKAGNDFLLYWLTEGSATGNLADVVAAPTGIDITWAVAGRNGLSHLSFYNSGRTEVLEPDTLALFSLGLLGIAFATRRRRIDIR